MLGSDVQFSASLSTVEVRGCRDHLLASKLTPLTTPNSCISSNTAPSDPSASAASRRHRRRRASQHRLPRRGRRRHREFHGLRLRRDPISDGQLKTGIVVAIAVSESDLKTL